MTVEMEDPATGRTVIYETPIIMSAKVYPLVCQIRNKALRDKFWMLFQEMTHVLLREMAEAGHARYSLKLVVEELETARDELRRRRKRKKPATKRK